MGINVTFYAECAIKSHRHSNQSNEHFLNTRNSSAYQHCVSFSEEIHVSLTAVIWKPLVSNQNVVTTQNHPTKQPPTDKINVFL